MNADERGSEERDARGNPVCAIESLWRAEIEDFRRIRMRYLIYDRDSE